MALREIKQILRNKTFQTSLKIILGLFFIVSGLFKIFDPASFGKIILSYDMVPKNWIIPLAIIIPYVELGIGLAFLLNLFPKLVSSFAIILMIVFTAISMYKYIQGDVSDCGCFGRLIERKNDWNLLVENTIVVFLLGITFIKDLKGSS